MNSALRLILQQRGHQGGYQSNALARISPHTLRAGCIITVAQASVHERDIMARFRHGSQAVMRSPIRAAGTEEAFISGALWRRKELSHHSGAVRRPDQPPTKRWEMGGRATLQSLSHVVHT